MKKTWFLEGIETNVVVHESQSSWISWKRPDSLKGLRPSTVIGSWISEPLHEKDLIPWRDWDIKLICLELIPADENEKDLIPWRDWDRDSPESYYAIVIPIMKKTWFLEGIETRVVSTLRLFHQFSYEKDLIPWRDWDGGNRDFDLIEKLLYEKDLIPWRDWDPALRSRRWRVWYPMKKTWFLEGIET